MTMALRILGLAGFQGCRDFGYPLAKLEIDDFLTPFWRTDNKWPSFPSDTMDGPYQKQVERSAKIFVLGPGSRIVKDPSAGHSNPRALVQRWRQTEAQEESAAVIN